MKILAVDIGGTKVKVLASGQTEPRRAVTGRDYTPTRMVREVRALARGWEYEAVSIGFPGPAGHSGPKCEPGNLGCGWVGFDFAAAFDRPVKIINDAAMQALGSYDGGRMLFLGLGTGLGAAMITSGAILPMELSHLPWRGTRRTVGDVLGRRAVERRGVSAWRRVVDALVPQLMQAFLVDYVVLGGGNAKRLKRLPPGARRGHNLTAFRGGFRLWGVDDVPIMSPDDGGAQPHSPPALEWRLV